MLHGWTQIDEVTYCADDLEDTRLAKSALAHNLAQVYQIEEHRSKAPVIPTKEMKAHNFQWRHRWQKRRLTRSGQVRAEALEMAA